jgi:hypothetical protein
MLLWEDLERTNLEHLTTRLGGCRHVIGMLVRSAVDRVTDS